MSGRSVPRVIALILLSLSILATVGVALAVNVATDTKAWPWKLEEIRQHPWISLAALIIISIVLSYLLWKNPDSQPNDSGQTSSATVENSAGAIVTAGSENIAINTGVGGSAVSLNNVTADTINFYPPPTRAHSVEASTLRQSHARTRTRLRSIGLSEDQVSRVYCLLNERALLPALAAHSAGRLMVLAGELGSGKSEIAESWYRQSAEAEIASNGLSPIPIWISARDISETIGSKLRRHLPDWSQVGKRGCDLVIDELDAITDVRKLNALLLEAGEFADANEKVRVVATIRPGYSVAAASRIDVPPLESEEALELVRAVISETKLSGRSLPPSIVEVIRTPLFALLAARHLAALPQPFTRAALLQLTAEEGIQIAEGRTGVRGRGGSTGLVLRSIAVASIAGTPMRPGDVSDIDSLLQSQLVVERKGRLLFPIAIIEQYLAGQAILRGEVEIDATSPVVLTRWRYAIAVALAASDADGGADLMERITRNSPAIASWLVEEAIATTTGRRSTQNVPTASGADLAADRSSNEAAGDAVDAGRALRRAMGAWIDGLGAIGVECGPTGIDGELRPLGVSLSESGSFQAVWARGALPDVFPLFGEKAPKDLGYEGILRLPAGWGPGRVGPLPDSVKWEWRWGRETLRRELEKMLKQRRLPVRAGSFLESETVWKLAKTLSSPQ